MKKEEVFVIDGMTCATAIACLAATSKVSSAATLFPMKAKSRAKTAKTFFIVPSFVKKLDNMIISY